MRRSGSIAGLAAILCLAALAPASAQSWTVDAKYCFSASVTSEGGTGSPDLRFRWPIFAREHPSRAAGDCGYATVSIPGRRTCPTAGPPTRQRSR
jgi:hypothetical protein